MSLHGGRDRAHQEGVRFTSPMTVGASGVGSAALKFIGGFGGVRAGRDCLMSHGPLAGVDVRQESR